MLKFLFYFVLFVGVSNSLFSQEPEVLYVLFDNSWIDDSLLQEKNVKTIYKTQESTKKSDLKRINLYVELSVDSLGRITNQKSNLIVNKKKSFQIENFTYEYDSLGRIKHKYLHRDSLNQPWKVLTDTIYNKENVRLYDEEFRRLRTQDAPVVLHPTYYMENQKLIKFKNHGIGINYLENGLPGKIKENGYVFIDGKTMKYYHIYKFKYIYY